MTNFQMSIFFCRLTDSELEIHYIIILTTVCGAFIGCKLLM